MSSDPNEGGRRIDRLTCAGSTRGRIYRGARNPRRPAWKRRGRGVASGAARLRRSRSTSYDVRPQRAFSAEASHLSLEINSQAGLFGADLQAATTAGYNFSSLINRVLDVAHTRYFGICVPKAKHASNCDQLLRIADCWAVTLPLAGEQVDLAASDRTIEWATRSFSLGNCRKSFAL